MHVTTEVTTSDPLRSLSFSSFDSFDLISGWLSNVPFYDALNSSSFDSVNESYLLSPSAAPSFPQDYAEWRIARSLWIWVAPILLLIGASGNGLSFIILRSCSFSKCSIAFTLSALAIVDTSVLFTNLGRQWIFYVTDGFDVRTVLWSFGCKFHLFLTYYLGQLSSWTLVVVTIERVVCISMPFFARTACTKSRIVLSWVLVAIFLAVLNSHFFWTARYYEIQVPVAVNTTKGTSMCFIGFEHRDFFYKTWYWIDFTLLSIIPFIFIFTGNIVITVCVFRAMKFRQQQTPTVYAPPLGQTSTESCKPLTSSTAMLIGISVLFLIATTPSAIYFLLFDTLIGDASDAHEVAKTRLVFAITNLLHFANNALNFILYCLTGSRFRRAFVDHFRRQSVDQRSRPLSRGVTTMATKTSNYVQRTGNYELQLSHEN